MFRLLHGKYKNKAMNTRFFILFLSCISLIACDSNFENRPQDKPAIPSLKQVQENLSGAAQSLDLWTKQRAYPNDRIQSHQIAKAFKEKKIQETLRQGPTPPEWEALGPANVGGRTLDVAVNPLNKQHLWLGSASGGLWRSYTEGEGDYAWKRVPINFPVLGVSSILIHPLDTNIMYIGTGEVYNSDESAPGVATKYTRGTYGVGILKTEDGGETWTPTLYRQYEWMYGVQKLLFHPADPNTVFAATTEGLLRTTNAGVSWDIIHDLPMAVDIVVNPEIPSIILVTHGSYLHNSISGLYYSVDSGTSFNQALYFPSGYAGKALIDYAPSDPQKMYASVANVQGSVGLLASTDFGLTWDLMNDENIAQHQGWFAHDIAVSPSNENTLINVGIDVHKSINGGSTLVKKSFWTKYIKGQVPADGPEGIDGSYVHADIHRVFYDETNANKVFLCTDGGLFISNDGGESFEGRNGGLQTSQFYADFSNSTTDPNFAMGGMQDNYSVIYKGHREWTRVLGGDGMGTQINPDNDQIMYGSSQRGNIYRSLDRGENFTTITPADEVEQIFNFSSPLRLAPSNSDILYLGGQTLFRSEDGGTTWETTYPDFLFDNPILKLAVSPDNPNHLILSTSDIYIVGGPSIKRTYDGGVTFFPIDANNLPDRYAMDIEYDPNNSDIIYLCYSGFGTDHVFQSVDNGITWASIDNGLPDVPTNTIFIDPMNSNILYVGNDIGVYYSLDQGTNWEIYSEGLPDMVMVMDLSYSPVNRKLRIATHGNGVFQADMADPLVANENPMAASLSVGNIFPNPVKEQLAIFIKSEQSLSIISKIYAINGQSLISPQTHHLMVGENQLKFEVGHLPQGAYLLSLTLANGKVISRSFVK